MYNLSIIIPHYNSADKLDRLLKSIPLRDYSIQVIVVDDKSDKDQVEKLSSRYKDQYFNLILLANDTRHKGAGVCRNIGLDYAIGKWILFADADDFFVPDFYTIVKKYLNEDCDVVYFTPTSVEEYSMHPSNRHDQYEELINTYLAAPSQDNELMLRYKFYVPWSKLYNRNFLMQHQIKFDEILVANDVMFSTKSGYYMKKFKVSKDVLYCCTQDTGSLITLINEKAYDTRLSVYVEHCRFLFERLNSKQIKLLNLTGRGYLITGVKHQFSFPKLLSIVYILRKNNIGLFDWRYFNPVFFIKRARLQYGVYKDEKRFYTKS